jgi:CRISPR/Cas system type I-B associated protein Csh2 (Cas7 group RAMP superfamily)
MNYEWNVVQMDRKSSDGFVTTVHYTVNAVDGEYNASTYGTVGFTQEDTEYVPFDDLTQEQVIAWVQDSLGQATVEESLATQIEAKKNPVQVSGLPWSTEPVL